MSPNISAKILHAYIS